MISNHIENLPQGIPCIFDYCDTQLTASAPSALDSRFFIDNGDWKTAPILKGQGSFTPISRVKNILITGGAGFM